MLVTPILTPSPNYLVHSSTIVISDIRPDMLSWSLVCNFELNINYFIVFCHQNVCQVILKKNASNSSRFEATLYTIFIVVVVVEAIHLSPNAGRRCRFQPLYPTNSCFQYPNQISYLDIPTKLTIKDRCMLIQYIIKLIPLLRG